VVDGQTGRLVEAGNVAELTRVLGEAIGNPQMRATLGTAALAHVGRDCNAEAGYDAIADLIRERIA
jgi:hypothetical protein